MKTQLDTIEADFRVPYSHSQVSVAAILEVNILPDIIVLSRCVIIVSCQVRILCIQFRIEILHASKLSLSIF